MSTAAPDLLAERPGTGVVARRPGPQEIVLDLSRLLSRLLHVTPTGVDRVEMAYARELLKIMPDQLAFSAVHPIGLYGRLGNAAVRAFLAETEALWNGEVAAPQSDFERWSRAAKWMMRLWPQPIPAPQGARVLLQSSPHHLDREDLQASILRRERARFACLVHDLIPIEFPEYARPGGDRRHLKRVRTIARHADAIIANSAATRASLLPYLKDRPEVVIEVACLGLDGHTAPAKPRTGKPYFVCLGTIEPRKNHLLLLNIWRRFAEQHRPSEVPRLIIIGRRGWENEQVVDMLERCPGLEGAVEERNGLSDAEMRHLLQGASALLLPSFAEGYGMPVPEALALGVPVICSDLPALREAGGNVPDYLDPLDGIRWLDAIEDFARDGPMRTSQMRRVGGWQPWTWDQHMQRVRDAIEASVSE